MNRSDELFTRRSALEKLTQCRAQHPKKRANFLATLSLCRTINLASKFTIPMQRAWFFSFSHTHKLPCAPVLFSLLEFRYQFPSSEQQLATLRLIIELIMKDITRIFLLGPSEMGIYGKCGAVGEHRAGEKKVISMRRDLSGWSTTTRGIGIGTDISTEQHSGFTIPKYESIQRCAVLCVCMRVFLRQKL